MQPEGAPGAVPMVMPVSVPVNRRPSTPIRMSPAPQLSEIARDSEDQAVLYPHAMCGPRTMSLSVSNTLIFSRVHRLYMPLSVSQKAIRYFEGSHERPI